jgi:hypothetical protein
VSCMLLKRVLFDFLVLSKSEWTIGILCFQRCFSSPFYTSAIPLLYHLNLFNYTSRTLDSVIDVMEMVIGEAF